MNQVAESRNDAKYFRDIVYERTEGCCEACGVYAPFILELHHVVPVSRGGNGFPDNLAALCPNCHAVVTKSHTQMADNPNFSHWIYEHYGEKTFNTLLEISCAEWKPYKLEALASAS